MTTVDRAPDLTREPPPPTKRVLTIGLIGIGITFLAFLMGLLTSAPLRGFEPHWADGPRALLCVVGLLVCGCAVSLRPSWFGGWLCGSAAALIAYGFGAPPPNGTEWYLAPPRNWYAGVPNSWDSVQLFFGVACVIGLIGAIWTVLPQILLAVVGDFAASGLFRGFFRWLAPNAALLLILFGVAFHFAGILSAITSPPPTPWLTDQYWKRIARPYLQFAYMNNAYQFYSPDPGPACELWICVEYRPLRPGEDPNGPVDANEFKELEAGDDPDTPRDCEWFYVPRREADYKDPLGLSFYRRLAVSENVAQYQPPGHIALRAEQEKVAARRAQAARDFIPRTYPDDNLEHRVPNELVVRQILPSYVRHFAYVYSKPDKAIKSIRVYRALHMITTLAEFRGYDTARRKDITPKSPYNPSLYMPYFQGKFTRDGRLIDPTDPMLYWLVPISPVPGREEVPLDYEQYRKNGGYQYYFTDYVSRHAGCDRPIKE